MTGPQQVARRVRDILGPNRSAFFFRHPRWWRVYLIALAGAAFLWRRLLLRTTFIAVTGSTGKTTAKDCLAKIFARKAPAASTYGTDNWLSGVPRTMLSTRPWHRCAVVEIGAGEQGIMRHLARLVRPQVALVLSLCRVHTRAFPTLEAMAAEKAQLVKALGKRGHAVLNGDDERVRAMAARCRGTVHLFGSSPEHEVWYDQVAAAWPARLSFTVHTPGQSRRIETNLLGAHWASSVTAVIAAARLSGLDLETIAAGILELQPHPARMQPVELPCGATILRDDYSGVLAAFQATVSVLREATAARRLAVVSQLADSGMSSPDCYRYLGETLADATDVLVLVGADSGCGCQAAVERGLPRENVHGFESVREAAVFLRNELRAGDLALLKGRHADQLSRIFFAQLGHVRCWVQSCQQACPCDDCPELGFTPFEAGCSSPNA